MRDKLKYCVFSVFGLMLFLNSSCEKWRNNRETYTSENHTLAESSFIYIMHNILIAASNEGLLLENDTCFNISSSGNSFPKTITLDFGSGNCKGIFQTATTGILSATISDSAATSVTIIPQNFKLKGYEIEGGVKVDRVANNKLQMTVRNGIVKSFQEVHGEEYVLSWQGTYIFELKELNVANLSFDDFYEITGSASGVNEEGRAYTAEIIEPLQKYVDCRWPGSGLTRITPEDLKERDLFYGIKCAGNHACCDNIGVEQAKWLDRTVHMK